MPKKSGKDILTEITIIEGGNMRLTESQLRQTIRRVIVENQQYYEKLVNMILIGDVESINQALELALTMGYVTDLQYEVEPPRLGSFTRHLWKMGVDPEFEAEIKRQYRIDFSSNKVQIFYGVSAPKPGTIKVQLYAPSGA